MEQLLIGTYEKYEPAVRYLQSHEDLVMDVETNGLDHNKNHVIGVGVLTGEQACYFPFRHEQGTNLPENLMRDLCFRVLDPTRMQTGFNYKFDIKMMRKEGMEAPQSITDVICHAHLMNENEKSFKMESLAEKYVDPGAGASEDEMLNLIVDKFGGSKKRAKGMMWKLDPKDAYEYGTQDLITTRQLRDFYRPHLSTWTLTDLAAEVDEYVRVLAEIELRGTPIDVDLIKRLSPMCEENEARLLAEINELAGEALNPNSSKQVSAYFGTAKADKETLELMDSPLANKILECRGWRKARSTYYDALLAAEHLGRVHPDYRVTGTVTDRLTCGNVPVMLIPREGREHFQVKDCFIAAPGRQLIEADVSQAEIRACAHYTRDPALLEIICKGLNMHDKVKSDLGVPRHVAKQLNLSSQYGIGAKRFSENYGMPFPVAKAHLAAYKRKFRGITQFRNECTMRAEQWGYVQNYAGRYRHFNSPRAKKYHANNAIIQSSIAAMLRRIILRVHHELPEVEINMQVHDSIVAQLPEKNAKELAGEVKRIMEDQDWSSVDYVADVKMGRSWGNAKDIDL